MLTDSLKERLFAKYKFLYDALDQVQAGKRLSEDEEAALRDRYASVAQGVLAERAVGYQMELLGAAMVLVNALCPGGAEAEAIEKITPIPKVKLRYGFESALLEFVEPPRPQWSKQNCEFLRGFPTGLSPPFAKVFVKRVRGQPVSGHELLMKLTGQALPFSPTFLGYKEIERYRKAARHIYFFENLAPGFSTLESELNNTAPICSQTIADVVRKAASLFRTIYRLGFIYPDFGAKNIMVDRRTQEIAIIDVDSCVPAAVLLKPEKSKMAWQEEYWGLWSQHLTKARPLRMENAQKSVVFSFAALWCRALALKYSAGGAGLTALKLVHNPSYQAQRPLWEALNAQNKAGFLQYFGLREVGAADVYAQWQAAFNAFLRGQEVAWQDIVRATKNLVREIGRKGPTPCTI